MKTGYFHQLKGKLDVSTHWVKTVQDLDTFHSSKYLRNISQLYWREMIKLKHLLSYLTRYTNWRTNFLFTKEFSTMRLYFYLKEFIALHERKHNHNIEWKREVYKEMIPFIQKKCMITSLYTFSIFIYLFFSLQSLKLEVNTGSQWLEGLLESEGRMKFCFVCIDCIFFASKEYGMYFLKQSNEGKGRDSSGRQWSLFCMQVSSDIREHVMTL